MLRSTLVAACLLVPLAGTLTACNTAPKAPEARAAFLDEAAATRLAFEQAVPGLNRQIADSAAYIVFPDIGQAGFIVGGQGGRGAVFRPSGQHIGWATISTANIGLQAGVQNYKMLAVLQDEATVDRFRNNRLTGSANSVAVAGDRGGSAVAPFANGVAAYHMTRGGLMAGLQIGLDLIRFAPEYPGDPD